MDKLQQIALKAGVSPNTVLRVLRGENKEVWPSSLKRADEIRSLARDLAYLPNGSARAMRRGRFNCVSLVLSTDGGRSHLPEDLFNAIHDAVAEQGMRLIVAKLPDSHLTSPDRLPSILREMSCDGLLINYTDHVPPEMVELIGQYRIPSVWINSRQQHDCVYYDDFNGCGGAVKSLIELGHRRIAYLDFLSTTAYAGAHYSRQDRREGYLAAMKSAGLTPYAPESFAGVSVGERLAATRELMVSADRPTAIIGYDSGERLLYAAALAGLEVPKDLSLLTFTSKHALPARQMTGEHFVGRSVASIRLPTEKAGREAVEMLLQKIAAPQKRQEPRVLPLEFQPGDTVSPAPAPAPAPASASIARARARALAGREETT